jgi:hypothetical protein
VLQCKSLPVVIVVTTIFDCLLLQAYSQRRKRRRKSPRACRPGTHIMSHMNMASLALNPPQHRSQFYPVGLCPTPRSLRRALTTEDTVQNHTHTHTHAPHPPTCTHPHTYAHTHLIKICGRKTIEYILAHGPRSSCAARLKMRSPRTNIVNPMRCRACNTCHQPNAVQNSDACNLRNAQRSRLRRAVQLNPAARVRRKSGGKMHSPRARTRRSRNACNTYHQPKAF